MADEELLNPAREITKNVYSNINGFSLTGLATYTTYTVSMAAISGGGVGVHSEILYIGKCSFIFHFRFRFCFCYVSLIRNTPREDLTMGCFPPIDINVINSKKL